MKPPVDIPVFTLFGETAHFPDIVHCEDFSARAAGHGWHISAHRHAHMAQLFIIADGSVTGKVDGLDLTLKSGDFLYIPAQKVHAFQFEPDTLGQVISFPQNVINMIGPASADIQSALSEPFTGRIQTQLFQLTDLLIETTKSRSTFRAQQVLGLAHTMLGSIAQIARESDLGYSRQTDLRLSTFNTMITKNIGKSWSASDYAAALSLSTSHLSRLCRAATGRGAAAYIEHSVMEEACRLLAFTQLPVSEIGYRLGYDDPSYFSKRFRITRQQAPSDYRTQFVG